MTWQERITVDPLVLLGKPVVKGTRLSVEFILELLADGWSVDQLAANYPQLTSDDVHAVLRYAADVLKRERVYPLSA